MSMRLILRSGAAVLAVLLPAGLLSGCKEQSRPPTPPPANAGADLSGHARQVVEQSLRAASGQPAATRVRGVQVYSQAQPRQMAVCGQVSQTMPEAFVPFVAVVSYKDGPGSGTPLFHIDQYVADSVNAATRVWSEMIARCYENGGPPPGPRAPLQPLPPMPDVVATRPGRPVAEPPAVPVPMPPDLSAGSPRETPPSPSREVAPPTTAASGSVMMRQNGNLRSSPTGGGEVLRVVPKNTVLQVFGEAPGGWYQVGDGAPWGWVHGSLVTVQP